MTKYIGAGEDTVVKLSKLGGAAWVKSKTRAKKAVKDLAEQLVKRGWMISISGVVTFRNAKTLPEVAARIPLSHLLIETDCPYLTPHPHRGKTNHSGYLTHTAACIAALRGITEEEVRDATRENAVRFFGIR